MLSPSTVHAAFGKHFVKTGMVPEHFHRYIIRAMEVREAGDYSKGGIVTPEESAEQIARADEFLRMAKETVGFSSSEPDDVWIGGLKDE